MSVEQESLDLHQRLRGKIGTLVKTTITSRQDLSLAYTPGVAEPCRQINQKPETVYTYTNIGNTVAVITDGSAVLGLGDIGPQAGLPVMEGKCVLFKEFADIDAFPIALATKETQEIINTIKNIAPSFGGINLEDISAPRCFAIEAALKEELDIPVFHDDQHGTAVVVLAALINALKITGRPKKEIKVLINGVGAAGTAIAKILFNFGVTKLTILDSRGVIYISREDLNLAKKELITLIDKDNKSKAGSLAEAIVDQDVFIGVSGASLLTVDMVKDMSKEPIIFALANPIPEIMPDQALAAGARIVGTGRSDFPNQINNVLAFPGIFKGALAVRAKTITEEMKLVAAQALADYIDQPIETKILPDPLDKGVVEAIAKKVSAQAILQGVASQ